MTPNKHAARRSASSLLLVALSLLALLVAPALTACGDDRSGEQPFAPTVVCDTFRVTADSAVLTGIVTSSVNSTLTECGFKYGNDTLTLSKSAAAPADTFSVVTDSLGAGTYYAVAFAKNGMGTTYATDTMRFAIE